jgi:hypothetical protein
MSAVKQGLFLELEAERRTNLNERMSESHGWFLFHEEMKS